MPAKREAALKAGAAAAYDPADPDARKALLKATGGVYGAVDFVGSDGSLAFATGALAKGGKVVITGLLGGTYTTPIAMFPLRGVHDRRHDDRHARRGERDDGAGARRQGPAGADQRAAARAPRRPRSTICARARSSAAWCWRRRRLRRDLAQIGQQLRDEVRAGPVCRARLSRSAVRIARSVAKLLVEVVD